LSVAGFAGSGEFRAAVERFDLANAARALAAPRAGQILPGGDSSLMVWGGSP
jgi:hypothetical protein